MMYKAKAAVCSQIRKKHSTQRDYHVEFLNINNINNGERSSISRLMVYILNGRAVTIGRIIKEYTPEMC